MDIRGKWFFSLFFFTSAVFGNDHFADRSSLGEQAPIEIDSTHVGASGGEIFPQNPSRWWTWSPSRTGWHQVSLNVVHSASVAVFHGNQLNTLQTAGQSRMASQQTPATLPFFAEAGLSYQIVILAAPHTPLGPFSFRLDPIEHPSPNDSFTDSVDLGEALDVTILARNHGASAGSDEPHHGGWNPKASVWWSFSPTRSRSYRFHLTQNPSFIFLPRFALYEGDSLESLTLVKSLSTLGYFDRYHPKPDIFHTQAGKNYHLVMDQSPKIRAQSISISFRIKELKSPNDTVETATNLGTTLPVDFTADFDGATREEDEFIQLNHQFPPMPLQQTIWWRWECPKSGSFALQTRDRSRFHNYFLSITPEGVAGEPIHFSFQPLGNRIFDAQEGQILYFMMGTTSQDYLPPVSMSLFEFTPSLNRTSETAIQLGVVGDFDIEGETFTNDERSLVYQWTSASGGNYRVDSPPRQALPQVFRVNFDNSVERVSINQDGNFFPLQAGRNYRLFLGQYSPDFYTQKISRLPTLLNDDFRNAIDLGAAAFVQSKSHTYGSGLEAVEPQSPTLITNSVWWKWRAPSSGAWQLASSAPSAQTYVEVFRGSSLATLKAVTQTALPSQSLVLEGGELYFFRVSSNKGEEVNFNISTGLPTSNDLRVDAIDLGNGDTAEAHGDYTTATTQPEEPGLQNLWWRWTAPSSGEFRLAIRPRNTQFKVYQGLPGQDFTDLTPVDLRRLGPLQTNYWENDLILHETVVFTARENEDYLILTSTNMATSRTSRVNFSIAPFLSVAGDSFANRIDLGHKSAVRYRGYAANATTSATDPPSRDSFSGSVWMTWEAPASGYFEVENFGSGEDAIGVYTGDTPGSLNKVFLAFEDEDEDRFINGFFAEEGRSYQIVYLTEDNQGEFEITITSPRSYEHWIQGWQDSLIRRQLPRMTEEEMKREAGPQGDGISNITKYVFGLDPTRSATIDPNQGNLPSLVKTDDYLEVRYRLGGTAASATTIRVRHVGEWSSDGRVWSSIEPEPVSIGTYWYRIRVPINDSQKLVRIRAWEQ